MPSKACTECAVDQPLADFSPCPRMNDGRASVCKKCNAARQRARRRRLSRRTDVVPPKTKKCSRCGKRKPASGYYSNLANLDGLSSSCRACTQASRRAFKYGLTESQFGALVTAHAGRCAICDRPFKGPKEPAVDHDHTTGVVRGLLCKPCNQGLGFFRDDPATLKKAMTYLRKRKQGWPGLQSS